MKDDSQRSWSRADSKADFMTRTPVAYGFEATPERSERLRQNRNRTLREKKVERAIGLRGELKEVLNRGEAQCVWRALRHPDGGLQPHVNVKGERCQIHFIKTTPKQECCYLHGAGWRRLDKATRAQLLAAAEKGAA